MEMEKQAYPVSLKGELTVPPARGWWLIKWLLFIPHLFCLIGLGIAFVFVCIIAFFAILFTGKYPKSLFEFNTGVLRWAWRVGFYSCAALGTDKYPPFSLRPDPNYPADLDIPYSEKFSRGLVLVKWWLLAIPHYIIVSIFIGGMRWGNTPYHGWCYNPMFYRGGDVAHVSNTGSGPGLIIILAIFAGVALLFTGKYPQSIFKLVIGFNRWVFRVAAYVFLMTDKYPPFRLWDD